MLLWQVFLICAMVFILIEIFVPMFFFLNFAIGCIITAGIAMSYENVQVLILLAIIVSALSLAFLRPLLIKQRKSETGVEDKYIGKVVKVIEPINANGGAITIYGERWSAKSSEEIPAGVDVKIIRNDSLVFYVEKI
jgi:membrane protein implicated in regulation of membrane protease activity